MLLDLSFPNTLLSFRSDRRPRGTDEMLNCVETVQGCEPAALRSGLSGPGVEVPEERHKATWRPWAWSGVLRACCPHRPGEVRLWAQTGFTGDLGVCRFSERRVEGWGRGDEVPGDSRAPRCRAGAFRRVVRAGTGANHPPGAWPQKGLESFICSGLPSYMCSALISHLHTLSVTPWNVRMETHTVV